jgi:hypothetical protein
LSVGQRLQRLEHVEYERQLYEYAERIAQKHGKAPDDVLRMMREIAARVERWGIEAEHRRLAHEYGISEEEVQQRYDEVVAEGL